MYHLPVNDPRLKDMSPEEFEIEVLAFYEYESMVTGKPTAAETAKFNNFAAEELAKVSEQEFEKLQEMARSELNEKPAVQEWEDVDPEEVFTDDR